MFKTVYIGAKHQAAEYIFHNEEFSLKAIICEKNKLSDELLTFSLVRDVHLYVIESKLDLVDVMTELGNDYVYIMHVFALKIPVNQLPGYKIFNIHPSNLPDYKGAHPTYWATVNNEINIGVSLHEVTEGLDEGVIIGQETVPYYIWENEVLLQEKISAVIPSLLNKLVLYINGENISTIKNRAGSYYPRVTDKDVYIDLQNDSPAMIYNKVRAEAIYNGAKIRFGDNTFCILKMLFQKAKLDNEYLEENGHLYIRYNDELIIDAISYKCKLNES